MAEQIKSTTREGAVNAIKAFGRVLIERAEDYIGQLNEVTGYTITLSIDMDFSPTIEITKTVRPKSVMYALLPLANDMEAREREI